jgi:hypothetical protein
MHTPARWIVAKRASISSIIMEFAARPARSPNTLALAAVPSSVVQVVT